MLIEGPEPLLKVPGYINGYLVILFPDYPGVAGNIGSSTLIFKFHIEPIIVRSVGRGENGDNGGDTPAF